MFRNQYDTDVTTFSPAGRLHQVEYAAEAVNQGSAVVGLVSKSTVVLAALRRSQGELASHQRKIFKIDDHLGIAISGLVADARVLCEYMREEALNHKFLYDSPIDSRRLVTELSDKSQRYTQTTTKRPYGVGLLVAGNDRGSGPHLFQTSPTGVHYEFLAQAIGARSQSARTYLQRHVDSFTSCTDEELVEHALKALQGCAQDGKLTSANCSVCVVSESPLRELSEAELQPFLARLPVVEKRVFDDAKGMQVDAE